MEKIHIYCNSNKRRNLSTGGYIFFAIKGHRPPRLPAAGNCSAAEDVAAETTADSVKSPTCDCDQAFPNGRLREGNL